MPVPDPLTLLVGLILGDNPPTSYFVNFGPTVSFGTHSLAEDSDVPGLAWDDDAEQWVIDADGWGVRMGDGLYLPNNGEILYRDHTDSLYIQALHFDSSDRITLGGGSHPIRITASELELQPAVISAANLPDTDPGTPGQLYQASGVVMVSL